MSEAKRIEYDKLLKFCRDNKQSFEYSGGYQCAVNNAWVYVIEGSYYIIYYKPFKSKNNFCVFVDNAYKSFDNAKQVIEFLGRV